VITYASLFSARTALKSREMLDAPLFPDFAAPLDCQSRLLHATPLHEVIVKHRAACSKKVHGLALRISLC